MMCARCVSAVRTEMNSIFAISWFVWPSASRRITSRSRSESGSAVLARLRVGLGGDEPGAERGVDVPPAGRDLAHGRDDLGVRRLLQHVAGRAGGEGLAHVARVVLHREDEHLRVGRLLEHERHALDPALAGHDDVHQDHVRLLLARLEHGRADVAGLADHLDVGLGVEQEVQAGADDRVVVDDQDADGGFVVVI